MSLYIRVQTSFWNHRKTFRLMAAIGDAALWLPPRLWSYAAENQPDGDFSDYGAVELSRLLGYQGDAQAMLEALQQASFMDGMRIHNWESHNAYHSAFSERAKKAATARWGKEKKGQDKKGKEKSKHCLGIAQASVSNASSIQQSKNSLKNKATQREIEDFAVEIGLPRSDGESCFLKWEGCGWMNGPAPIKDWKMTMRNWKLNKFLPSQKVNGHRSSFDKPQPKIRLIE